MLGFGWVVVRLFGKSVDGGWTWKLFRSVVVVVVVGC